MKEEAGGPGFESRCCYMDIFFFFFFCFLVFGFFWAGVVKGVTAFVENFNFCGAAKTNAQTPAVTCSLVVRIRGGSAATLEAWV